MENGGVIRAELYPEVAPNTVRNFVSLVQKGFYDGTIFHRVIPGFMIQGGDPEGTGMGGPGYEIRGEFTANGFQNDLNQMCIRDRADGISRLCGRPCSLPRSGSDPERGRADRCGGGSRGRLRHGNLHGEHRADL